MVKWAILLILVLAVAGIAYYLYTSKSAPAGGKPPANNLTVVPKTDVPGLAPLPLTGMLGAIASSPAAHALVGG